VPKPVDTGELLTALQLWLPLMSPPPAPVDASLPAGPAPAAAASGPLTGPDGPAKSSTAPPEHPVAPVVAAGVGPTILVVDDDFRNTFALRALLERGHRVIVADSGSQALEELEHQPEIDVVLMDIMMPVMDGYATMRAIRVHEEFRKLPIIAVTGKVMPGERQRCIDAGASDYVPKPIDSAELFAALRPWLPTPAQPTAA
jgi:CheY-like chemotaxis protein